MQDTCNNFHEPVLLQEVVAHLVTRSPGRYLDCTGGFGGHSQAILEKLTQDSEMWIADYHKPTAENLRLKFLSDKRVHVLNERFSMIFDNLVPPFHGILADFGISSPQLEDSRLGIGFNVEAPLDMRIDERLQISAQDILATYDEKDLADIFYNFGGERASRKLASAIVYDRKINKFYTTTTELKLLCERVLGRFYRGKKIHPATKIFQALRIAVNEELLEVQKILEKAPYFLAQGGRLALISFHEGEDRLVKTAFKNLESTGEFKRVTRKAIQPSDEEIKNNPRSRSAKMRVLERVL